MKITSINSRRLVRLSFLYINAIRYLTVKQIIYGIYTRCKRTRSPRVARQRSRFLLEQTSKIEFLQPAYIQWCGAQSLSVFGLQAVDCVDYLDDYLVHFSFHYLDWLNTGSHEQVLMMFRSYVVEEEYKDKWRWHPYTCSKRIISLAIFLANSKKGHESGGDCDLLIGELESCYTHLRRNFEYHVGANHVLTNWAATVIAEAVLCPEAMAISYERFKKEFFSQFCSALHYERSHAYSVQLIYEAALVFQFAGRTDQLFLGALIQVAQDLSCFEADGLTEFGDRVTEQTPQMPDVRKLLSRLHGGSPVDESMPVRNAPVEEVLGYHILRKGCLTLVVDAGTPSPSYQPGHAHDSTGAIAVNYAGRPVIGSATTTTYERSLRRALQRSRRAYSKVLNAGVSQQHWASFRIAKRRPPTVTRQPNSKRLSIMMQTDRGKWTRSLGYAQAGFVITDLMTPESRILSQFILAEGARAIALSERSIGIVIDDVVRLQLNITNNGKIKIVKKTIGSGYLSFREAEVIKADGLAPVSYEIIEV